MNATIAVAIIVGALFLYVIVRLLGNSGRATSNSPNSFPYDTGSTIAPPSWSPDSSSSASDADARCETSDSDSGDSGSCDSGGDGGGGGD